jgi:hypothetical protein
LVPPVVRRGGPGASDASTAGLTPTPHSLQ